ncbi:hypothetical protein PQR33_22755 [Paraburkholderia sediminicola]|jgi:hypothetical protein|uniref:hypothetical protein n=1 Tax=Paraburkholderia sediminicola TaxID=458836 RepID=UPI0038B90371
MNNRRDRFAEEIFSPELEAFAFCAMVDAVRKAQGRDDPAAFEAGTPQRAQAEIELIRDTLRMIGIEPDENQRT